MDTAVTGTLANARTTATSANTANTIVLRDFTMLNVRASRAVPLAVVHGGGKEIDAALAKAGIPKQ